MVQVVVVKPFTFTHTFVPLDPNNPDVLPAMATTDDPMMHAKDEYIPVGVHDLPDAMANHWFVQAHTDKPPLVLPKPGTPEYGAYQASAARRRAFVEAAIEQEAQFAAAEVRQSALLSGRVADNEEQAHAEEVEQQELAAEQAAENEAARTGRRVALPPRRGGGKPPAPAGRGPGAGLPDDHDTPQEQAASVQAIPRPGTAPPPAASQVQAAPKPLPVPQQAAPKPPGT